MPSDDDIKRPGSGDGMTSSDTRKVVHGWDAMRKGQQLSRQERLLKEQEEKAARIKQGLPAEKEDTNYKPGEDDSSGEFNARRAKQFLTEMTKKTATSKTFTGNAQLCCAKLCMLFNGDDDGTAKPATNLKIVKVEEAGFGTFKITYSCD